MDMRVMTLAYVFNSCVCFCCLFVCFFVGVSCVYVLMSLLAHSALPPVSLHSDSLLLRHAKLLVRSAPSRTVSSARACYRRLHHPIIIRLQSSTSRSDRQPDRQRKRPALFHQAECRATADRGTVGARFLPLNAGCAANLRTDWWS